MKTITVNIQDTPCILPIWLGTEIERMGGTELSKNHYDASSVNKTTLVELLSNENESATAYQLHWKEDNINEDFLIHD